MTILLHLRHPLTSSLPIFEKWRGLVLDLIDDVPVFGGECAQSADFTHSPTHLSELTVQGLPTLQLTSVFEVPAPRGLDILVKLDCNDRTVCQGHDWGPSVLVIFGLSFMSDHAIRKLDACVIDWFAEAAELTEAKYGVIDIADGFETGFGGWLGGSDQQYASFQRRLARKMWAEEATRRPVALGAMWANWFGSEMVRQLGDLTEIREQVLKLADGLHPHPIREYSNGIIISLAGSIFHWLHPRAGLSWKDFDRAAWLTGTLAHSGLLPHCAATPSK